jgi:hypothetical protein
MVLKILSCPVKQNNKNIKFKLDYLKTFTKCRIVPKAKSNFCSGLPFSLVG